ncbi:MAG: UDP-4-amino-4,6-dideoxy-N-acetyl-beta-L-altrosamine transaminase [Alphaproteobacteria bacterium]|nr:UDP-4-amino-4,6-dideoxy-N-acetyl-beta-L-altrosamine transaminase [Alphaproteobacteria bacterium]
MADAGERGVTRFLGYGRQSIEQEDIDAVVAALKGDFLTQGPLVPALEKALAEACGAKYAVAVSSATAGLHIACLAVGMKSGDVGVTQPITFIASANCFAYCGAEIELADVDPDTMMMAPAALSEALKRRPEINVVVPVSFGGLSSDGAKLRAVAGPDRVIIEDASHSFGASEASGVRVGGGSWADMTVFSFHPVKPVTTGEGGAVLTNDKALYEKLLLLRSHGIERDADKLTVGEVDDPWWYEQQSLGFNYRLTDIQAALGVSQVGRIDQFMARRRAVAAQYDAAFASLNHIRLVQSDPAQRARSGHHLYILRIDFKALGTTRREVMARLKERQIGTQVHYIPVYKQPYHRPRFPDGEARFPVSEAFYDEALTIPCFPSMTDAEVAYVAETIKSVLKG